MRISEFPAGIPTTDESELVLAVQGGLTQKLTLAQANALRQPFSATLLAIAGVSGTGYLYRDGVGAWSLVPGTSGSYDPAGTAAGLVAAHDADSAAHSNIVPVFAAHQGAGGAVHALADVSAAGFMPILTGDSEDVLRGNGSWGSLNTGYQTLVVIGNVDSPHTLGDEEVILAETSVGFNVIINLPEIEANNLNGRTVTIKNRGDGNVIINVASGDDIDLALTYTIASPYASVTLVARADPFQDYWSVVSDVVPGVLWSKITNGAVIPIGSATPATMNRMHAISGTGAGYDITLPSPVAGDVVGFQVGDWSVADQKFRLDAGVGVKIAGRDRFLVLVHTNVVLLYFDGTDWQPLVLNLDTPWIDAGVTTITATTTNPTKGTAYDNHEWRRVGDSIEIHYDYIQYTNGAAGSGTYLFGLPFGVVFPSTVRTNTTNSNNGARLTDGVGIANLQESSFYATGAVKPYGTDKWRVAFPTNTAFNTVQLLGSVSDYQLGQPNVSVTANLRFPVENW